MSFFLNFFLHRWSSTYYVFRLMDTVLYVKFTMMFFFFGPEVYYNVEEENRDIFFFGQENRNIWYRYFGLIGPVIIPKMRQNTKNDETLALNKGPTKTGSQIESHLSPALMFFGL